MFCLPLVEWAGRGHRASAWPCHCQVPGSAGNLANHVRQTRAKLRHQPSTDIPIDLAVPAMISSAASMLVAFRSGILTCAMSLTCALVILPTLVLCGSALPLATPAAFLISSAAGGVFVMNEKVRSS